jgi:hypothetical protein
MKLTSLATACALIFSATLFGQNPEIQGRIDDFVASHSSTHEKKYLNITMPDVGNIKATFPKHVTEFMLRGKEKITNTLDQEVKERVFIAVYEYETPEDTRYALSTWMKSFMDGKSVKPGREMKRYPGAQPMYVLVDEQWIAFITLDCTEFDKKRWEAWESSFDKAFSNTYTRTMEVLCEGPLTWPRNPPDPKTFR